MSYRVTWEPVWNRGLAFVRPWQGRGAYECDTLAEARTFAYHLAVEGIRVGERGEEEIDGTDLKFTISQDGVVMEQWLGRDLAPAFPEPSSLRALTDRGPLPYLVTWEPNGEHHCATLEDARAFATHLQATGQDLKITIHKPPEVTRRGEGAHRDD